MKKLLVLSLFLAMGVYASAGLEWVVTGSTNPEAGKVNFGDTLTLQLMSTDGTTGLLVGSVTDGSAAGGFDATGLSYNAAFTTIGFAHIEVRR